MLESLGIILITIVLGISIPSAIIFIVIGFVKKNQNIPFSKIGLALMGLSVFVIGIFFLYYFVLSLSINNTKEKIPGEYILEWVKINSKVEKIPSLESEKIYLSLKNDSTFYLEELPFLKISGEGKWEYYFLDGHFVALDFKEVPNKNLKFYHNATEWLDIRKDSVQIRLKKRYITQNKGN